MKAETYLILEKKRSGIYSGVNVRVVKAASSRPRLSPTQICIKVNIELPEDAFEEYVPTANITVPSSSVLIPIVTVDGEGACDCAHPDPNDDGTTCLACEGDITV